MRIFTIILMLIAMSVNAQTGKTLLFKAALKFANVKDYQANVLMQFDLPTVKISQINGKVYFKSPNKFRLKTSGIAFLPKHNPLLVMQEITDTNTYNALISGYENLKGQPTTIVHVIPLLNNSDLVLGKFWINPQSAQIVKSELTTRTNGTLIMENTFGNFGQYALPDRILITVDMTLFKVPKAISADINSKSSGRKGNEKGKGSITLTFTNYKINQKLANTVFNEAS